MKLSLYDILAKLIPGGLVVSALFIEFSAKGTDYASLEIILFGFAMGYVVDALASFAERPLLFPTFGGSSGSVLLSGKAFMHIKIRQIEVLNQFLETRFPNLFEDKAALFSVIHRDVQKDQNPRIASFQENYIFSRNIFFAVPIAFGILCVSNFTILLLIVTALLFPVLWLRTKQRSYYFTKEVINSFVSQNMNGNVDAK
jgi:hypothetical protein